MTLLFRYFWFVFAGGIVLWAWLLYRRVAKLVVAGTITEDERWELLAAFVCFFGGSALWSGILMAWYDLDSPFCLEVIPASHPIHTALQIVILPLQIGAAYWILFGNGARILSKVLPALKRIPLPRAFATPARVRIAFIVLVLLLVGESKFSPSTKPPDVGRWCPALTEGAGS